MILEVYFKKNIKLKMPYNETTVLIGGFMHIPIIILILRFVESRFKRSEIQYQTNN